MVCISIHTGSRKVYIFGDYIPNIGKTHIEKMCLRCFVAKELWNDFVGTLRYWPPSVIGPPCYWPPKRYCDTLLLAPQALLGHLVIGTPNIIGAPCYWHPKLYWNTLLLATQTSLGHLVIGTLNLPH